MIAALPAFSAQEIRFGRCYVVRLLHRTSPLLETNGDRGATPGSREAVWEVPCFAFTWAEMRLSYSFAKCVHHTRMYPKVQVIHR